MFVAEAYLGHCQTSMMNSFCKKPVGNYMFKVNNRNTRTKCERISNMFFVFNMFFIVNFEHISHLALVFVLLTLSR